MTEAGDGLEEAMDFLEAQDDRELGLAASAGEPLEVPVPAECDAVEEFEGTEGLVVGAGGDVAVVGEVEQVGADLGGPQEFGGLAEVSGEAGDAVDVGPEPRVRDGTRPS